MAAPPTLPDTVGIAGVADAEGAEDANGGARGREGKLDFPISKLPSAPMVTFPGRSNDVTRGGPPASSSPSESLKSMRSHFE